VQKSYKIFDDAAERKIVQILTLIYQLPDMLLKIDLPNLIPLTIWKVKKTFIW